MEGWWDYLNIKVINERDLLLADCFAFLWILIEMDRSRRISTQTNNLHINYEMEGNIL